MGAPRGNERTCGRSGERRSTWSLSINDSVCRSFALELLDSGTAGFLLDFCWTVGVVIESGKRKRPCDQGL